MKAYTTACFFLFVFGSVLAQKTPDVPPPKEPFVLNIPQSCAWTITAEQPPKPPEGAAKSTMRTEVSVKYTKVGETRRIETIYSDGETLERWLVGTMSMLKPKGQEPMISDMAGYEDFNPMAQRQFPGVSWISLTSYDQPVLFEAKECYHYKAEGTEAWIECASGLPVAYKEAGVLQRYEFLPTPTGPLTLPADYQATWDAAMKLINRRNQLQKDLSTK